MTHWLEGLQVKGLSEVSERLQRLREAEAEQLPDAVAGRALLKHRIQQRSPKDVRAFFQAARLCYASAKKDETESAS
jgi:hypothetical protein